ncbi:dynein axonemal heavy chain 5-like [Rhynchophorus ferrugineus]|uniref:dynein axonemal heavy chain 5-like n=1 Tax=Rhynchophorus ferrugineus TaxID=354439 RepID=UPI003FCE792C
MNMDTGKGNVASIAYDLCAQLIDPPLKLSKEWGDLPKTSMGRMQKLNFVGDFDSFEDFLGKIKMDLEGVTIFTSDEELFGLLNDENEMSKYYFNTSVIQKVESLVRVWYKLIERCLVQYRQIRKENEFVGPNVEIEYWRRQLTRFTSIVEFLETDKCNVYINFLKSCRKHDIIKIWKKHVDLVYDTRNECTDNLKYLYSMEKYWEPLYRLDPPQLVSHIPTLLHAVRLVFTTSRYYNSTANVTAILVKVSNQIIKKCRDYLDCDGTKTVWNQLKKVVLDKIKLA